MKIYNVIDRGASGSRGNMAGGAVPASGAADSQPTAPQTWSSRSDSGAFKNEWDREFHELRRHIQSEHQRRAFRWWTALMLLCVFCILSAAVLASPLPKSHEAVTWLAVGGSAAFIAASSLLVWQARK